MTETVVIRWLLGTPMARLDPAYLDPARAAKTVERCARERLERQGVTLHRVDAAGQGRYVIASLMVEMGTDPALVLEALEDIGNEPRGFVWDKVELIRRPPR